MKVKADGSFGEARKFDTESRLMALTLTVIVGSALAAVVAAYFLF